MDINLGQWAGADLRKMAEESGTKDIYDAHYGWTSGFSHGHWAPMRDTTLIICLNALHRAHRIPADSKRIHGDVVPDAIELVETMIAALLQAYLCRARLPAKRAIQAFDLLYRHYTESTVFYTNWSIHDIARLAVGRERLQG